MKASQYNTHHASQVLRTLLTLQKDSSSGPDNKKNVAHASDAGSRDAPVHRFVPSLAAVCPGRPPAGTASAKCTLAAAVHPGKVQPASRSLASALQKGIAEGKYGRALQKGIAGECCRGALQEALQKGIAEGHCRRALRKGIAEGHCRRALQKGS